MTQLSDIYNEISDVARLIHQKGWADRNVGNFSIKIELDIESKGLKEYPLKASYPNLANKVFVVTGKGKRMRDIAKLPIENTIVLKINSDGASYVTSDNNHLMPTSELPSHLAIHDMISQRGSSEKAVIHTHVTELIALTHISEYCNQESLNDLIWRMHPETIMFLPNGVGFVPFELPGSAKIATDTVETLKSHQIALWEKHGVFSIGTNLNDCYDLIDIVAKSVKIYFLCATTGNSPQGISNERLDELKNIVF